MISKASWGVTPLTYQNTSCCVPAPVWQRCSVGVRPALFKSNEEKRTRRGFIGFLSFIKSFRPADRNQFSGLQGSFGNDVRLGRNDVRLGQNDVRRSVHEVRFGQNQFGRLWITCCAAFLSDEAATKYGCRTKSVRHHRPPSSGNFVQEASTKYADLSEHAVHEVRSRDKIEHGLNLGGQRTGILSKRVSMKYGRRTKSTAAPRRMSAAPSSG